MPLTFLSEPESKTAELPTNQLNVENVRKVGWAVIALCFVMSAVALVIGSGVYNSVTCRSPLPDFLLSSGLLLAIISFLAAIILVSPWTYGPDAANIIQANPEFKWWRIPKTCTFILKIINAMFALSLFLVFLYGNSWYYSKKAQHCKATVKLTSLVILIFEYVAWTAAIVIAYKIIDTETLDPLGSQTRHHLEFGRPKSSIEVVQFNALEDIKTPRQ